MQTELHFDYIPRSAIGFSELELSQGKLGLIFPTLVTPGAQPGSTGKFPKKSLSQLLSKTEECLLIFPSYCLEMTPRTGGKIKKDNLSPCKTVTPSELFTLLCSDFTLDGEVRYEVGRKAPGRIRLAWEQKLCF